MSDQTTALSLANELEALDKGMLTSMWAREGDKKVVAELRRQHFRIEADEALMRQALDALEAATSTHMKPNQHRAAITALRKRLESSNG